MRDGNAWSEAGKGVTWTLGDGKSCRCGTLTMTDPKISESEHYLL
jgi:hypothetical protein